jgi:hypothetical protein
MQILHQRLPREIRDEIYKHVLDEYTVKQIEAHSEIPREYTFTPFTHVKLRTAPPPDVQYPRFLQTQLVYRPVTEEIVTAFYESYLGFCVADVVHVGSFFDTAFLGFSITPAMCFLRSLKIIIYANEQDSKNFMDNNNMPAYFSRLVTQPWARHFKLQIKLEGALLSSTRGPRSDAKFPVNARTWSAVEQALQPLYAAIEEHEGHLELQLVVTRPYGQGAFWIVHSNEWLDRIEIGSEDAWTREIHRILENRSTIFDHNGDPPRNIFLGLAPSYPD